MQDLSCRGSGYFCFIKSTTWRQSKVSGSKDPVNSLRDVLLQLVHNCLGLGIVCPRSVGHGCTCEPFVTHLCSEGASGETLPAAARMCEASAHSTCCLSMAPQLALVALHSTTSKAVDHPPATRLSCNRSRSSRNVGTARPKSCGRDSNTSASFPTFFT